MITEAAIMKDGVIYKCGVGTRHYHIIRSQPFQFFSNAESTQGFVTDEGKFLDRMEAATHAFMCGQLKVTKGRLYSEDLW
jgi:hypothetical protein